MTRKPSPPSSSTPRREATQSRYCSFVHRHDPLGRSPLGEERIEAVEAADIEHAHPGEVLRKRADAVAMVARGAGRVDALSAVQRERVKPKGTVSTVARARTGSTSIGSRSATRRSAPVTTNRPRAPLGADPVLPIYTPPSAGSSWLGPTCRRTSREASSVFDQRSGRPTRDGRQASAIARAAGR